MGVWSIKPALLLQYITTREPSPDQLEVAIAAIGVALDPQRIFLRQVVLKMELIDKLKEIEASYRELEKKMADPEIVNDPHEMQQLGKKHVELTPIVDAFSEYEKVLNGIAEAKEMAEGDDEEMRELAKDELAELEARVPELEREIRILLLPKDMNDEKASL